MTVLHLRLTLETDVVLSASAATVGAHRTLRRIRGSALLGACAAQGYMHPRSFDLFHSGAVRYGDALPEATGAAAWPVPLSLHRDKLGTSTRLWNLAVAERPPGQQLTQVREGFVTVDARWLQVPVAYSMRTSIDDDGRARDGLLFGMESISAGQTFRATVTADDDALIDAVAERLVGRVHRIGRSRSAEFGLVHIERTDPPSESSWALVQGSTGVVRLWCRSDVALRDASTGAPRLAPEAADFGLPDGALLDPTHSFLRTGRWSPFNSYRRRPDLERQVILAGSVLVYQTPEVDLADLRTVLARGVGSYRQDGLGDVVIQPSFLEQAQIDLDAWDPDVDVAAGHGGGQTQLAPLPGDGLGRWLAARLDAESARDRVWTLSRAWAEQMKPYQDVPAAQWGEVRRRAALARIGQRGGQPFVDALQLHLGLTEPEVQAETDASGQGTRAPGPSGTTGDARASRDRRLGRGTTARRWSERRGGVSAAQKLSALLADAPAGDVALATELLAARMVRQLRQARQGQEDGGD